MKGLNKVIYILAILGLTTGLMAQGGDLPTGEVDVVKNFNAHLKVTNKVAVMPVLPPLDTSTARQYYEINAIPTQVQYLPPKIRPLSHKRGKVEDSYNGYAKIGAGFPSAFYGNLGYRLASTAKKKKSRGKSSGGQYDFGVDLFHHSANNTKNIENQRFSNTKGSVDGKYYFEEGFAVGGRIGYETDAVHFYGYNDVNEELNKTHSFEADDVKQRFNTLSMDFNVFNGERTLLDFNYNAGLSFYTLQDEYAASEQGVKIDIQGQKWFDSTHSLDVGLVTDFTNFKNGEKQSLHNFSLLPTYTYHADRFNVKVGANVTSHKDEFSFFPVVEANANILPGTVTAFIGANGGLKKNNFQNVSNYNPFVESKFTLRNTDYSTYYGGVKGVVSGVNYNVGVNYKNVENLALYQLSEYADSIARFDVLYDTASIVGINASLLAKLSDGIEAHVEIAQNIYNLDNEEKAWNLPAFTMNVGGSYLTLEKKLRVSAEAYIQNGVPYKKADGTAENLNALFDISLGADYYFSKNIGFFVKVNNLANNKRFRWHRYQTFGINALVGVNARF